MTFSLVQQIVPDFDKYRQRDPNLITHCVIHRSGPWPAAYGDPQDAQDLVNIFCHKEEVGKYVGYKMPYTFVLNPHNRVVYQSNYITAVTPHAKSQNKTGIGIAILQDLRNEALTPEAYVTLVKFCAYLRQTTGLDLTVAGHTDLPGATDDPDKECPGKMLDCARLDEDVRLAQRLTYLI